MIKTTTTCWMTCLLIVLSTASTRGVELQDITRLKGAETSTLVGMGLVVGLSGTGDGGEFLPAMRPLASMMQRLVDPNVIASELQNVENVALVSVTATIPRSGVREGDRLDVQIASVGAASSLEGGRLFLTPLHGPIPGSPIYAYAEGPVVIEDPDTPTTATIRNGAVMVRDVRAEYLDENGRLTLVINQPHATWPMAHTIAMLINDLMAANGRTIAQAVDQKNVVVVVPPKERADPGAFISRILEIHLDPALVRTEARVVINQSTGTIVITGDVQLSPVVISHQGLTITTLSPPLAPRAGPAGAPPPVPPGARMARVREQPFVKLDPGRRGGARLADLLAAFNKLKVPAQDRITIIKQIHRSGKLHARLIVEE